ncbi:MAG: tetratricopeptide repeat protein, partial [Campylobacterales bacterium]
MGSRNYWLLLLITPFLLFGIPTQEEACLKGDGEVCESLGYLYETGINRPKNLKKAFYFYSKGCEAGNSGACVAEGLMLLKGKGVKKDLEKGKKLLQNY